MPVLPAPTDLKSYDLLWLTTTQTGASSLGEEVPSGASIVLQVQLPGGLWRNATGAVSGERYRLLQLNHVIDQTAPDQDDDHHHRHPGYGMVIWNGLLLALVIVLAVHTVVFWQR